jgi:PIN domain nuclease of toxin-antitoxin system
VSIVSAWKMPIKIQLGKLRALKTPLRELVTADPDLAKYPVEILW